MESQMYKIFVGNVPFQCSQSEFSKCFDLFPGFIKAEIVYKQNLNLSRGFGFVTFDTKNNAMILLDNSTQIQCKDRTLRFTEYGSMIRNENDDILEQSNVIHDINLQLCKKKTESVYGGDISHNNVNKNIIVIKGFSNNVTREDLYNIFKHYGDISKYFIMSDPDTGTSKDCGIIEFVNKRDYENIIKQKEIYTDTGLILEINKWRPKNAQTCKQQNFCRNKKIFHESKNKLII